MENTSDNDLIILNNINNNLNKILKNVKEDYNNNVYNISINYNGGISNHNKATINIPNNEECNRKIYNINLNYNGGNYNNNYINDDTSIHSSEKNIPVNKSDIFKEDMSKNKSFTSANDESNPYIKDEYNYLESTSNFIYNKSYYNATNTDVSDTSIPYTNSNNVSTSINSTIDNIFSNYNISDLYPELNCSSYHGLIRTSLLSYNGYTCKYCYKKYNIISDTRVKATLFSCITCNFHICCTCVLEHMDNESNIKNNIINNLDNMIKEEEEKLDLLIHNEEKEDMSDLNVLPDSISEDDNTYDSNNQFKGVCLEDILKFTHIDTYNNIQDIQIVKFIDEIMDKEYSLQRNPDINNLESNQYHTYFTNELKNNLKIAIKSKDYSLIRNLCTNISDNLSNIYGIDGCNIINTFKNKYNEYIDTKCNICNIEYSKYDICRKNNDCGHFYHQQCIDTWFINNDICPICSTSIIK